MLLAADATGQTTLCTFHRHDYGSSQQFYPCLSILLAVFISAVRKNTTFAHVIYYFCGENKDNNLD